MTVLLLCLLLFLPYSPGYEIGAEQETKLRGSVCAYGDMNRDLYTDLLIYENTKLKLYTQVILVVLLFTFWMWFCLWDIFCKSRKVWFDGRKGGA